MFDNCPHCGISTIACYYIDSIDREEVILQVVCDACGEIHYEKIKVAAFEISLDRPNETC